MLDKKSIIEKLAAIEHERWSDWQRWCHKVLRENNPSPGQGDILERWDKQIKTPYSELSESEKQSDRDQVTRYWPIIEANYINKENIVKATCFVKDQDSDTYNGSMLLVRERLNLPVDDLYSPIHEGN